MVVFCPFYSGISEGVRKGRMESQGAWKAALVERRKGGDGREEGKLIFSQDKGVMRLLCRKLAKTPVGSADRVI